MCLEAQDLKKSYCWLNHQEATKVKPWNLWNLGLSRPAATSEHFFQPWMCCFSYMVYNDMKLLGKKCIAIGWSSSPTNNHVARGAPPAPGGRQASLSPWSGRRGTKKQQQRQREWEKEQMRRTHEPCEVLERCLCGVAWDQAVLPQHGEAGRNISCFRTNRWHGGTLVTQSQIRKYLHLPR